MEIYKEEHAESMAATDRQLIWPLRFAWELEKNIKYQIKDAKYMLF